MSRNLASQSLVAALLLGAGMYSYARAANDPSAEKAAKISEPLTQSAAEQTAVERALAQPVDCDYVEMPLKDVADSIAAKAGINVMLDIKSITDAGGSADTPITRKLKGISLRSALRLMLQEHELNFIAYSENVLLITSDAKAKEHVITRIYDAHDLTAPVRKFTGTELKLDDLIALVTSNIAPTTWTSAGGTGDITPFGMQLIVSQTPEIHEQIAELLSGLRQVRDAPQKIVESGGRLELQDSGSAAEIRKLLEKRHDLDFVETPLKDVTEMLRKLGVPVNIDLKSITDAGCSADSPITFKGKQLRLGTALKVMLQAHELNYIIDHEVLLITSDQKAREHVVSDFYPVGDLIGDTSGMTTKEIDDAYAKLVEAITANIAPTTWTEAGGSGSITPFPSCKALVCSQTDENHEALGALLMKLRAGQAKDATSAQQSHPPIAFATRFYQLAPDHADAAGDYVGVIRNLIEPKTWTGHEAFLGKVPGAIIVRCSPATHERIQLLLDELQALPRPPLGPTKSRPGGAGSGAGFLGGGMGGGGAF